MCDVCSKRSKWCPKSVSNALCGLSQSLLDLQHGVTLQPRPRPDRVGGPVKEMALRRAWCIHKYALEASGAPTCRTRWQAWEERKKRWPQSDQARSDWTLSDQAVHEASRFGLAGGPPGANGPRPHCAASTPVTASAPLLLSAMPTGDVGNSDASRSKSRGTCRVRMYEPCSVGHASE